MAEPLILVGTTLTPASDTVVRTGTALARGFGGRLVLVHVLAFPQTLARLLGPGTPGAEAMHRIHEQAQRELEAQIARVGIDGDRLLAVEVATGVPSRELAEEALRHGADLLLVGAAEGDGHVIRPLGSTAERVLRRARVPVMVVRDERAAAPRRALLAIDFSACSLEALTGGLAWLGRLGDPDRSSTAGGSLEITLLFVLSPFESAVGEVEVDYDSAERAARRELDRLLEQQTTVARVTPKVLRGAPAQRILDQAAATEANLVVLGTHGYGGRERLLLGSVAERVVREAPASVLVFPPAETEQS
jgi:nucleotide-binding universal stress UspA family protein